MKMLWPALQAMGQSTTRLDLATNLCRIIHVATAPDPDAVSVEDGGLAIERSMLATEMDSASASFSDLLRASGMGPASGEAAAASASTATGTA
jgi:hypothetical protein